MPYGWKSNDKYVKRVKRFEYSISVKYINVHEFKTNYMQMIQECIFLMYAFSELQIWFVITDLTELEHLKR